MLTNIRTFANKHPNIATILVLIAIIALVQIVLGTRATPITSIADVQARLHDGNPTIIEFYSNL